MRIVRLTLEGFKSYSHRVTIDHLHPQFNAITGPNGTGKSNIFDGICFAMGFRPGAQMRVKDISELIYKRGGAGITSAAVTIEFENSDKSMSPPSYVDQDTITVTRQIDTNNKDRHFVNGRVARTRDVHRLFAEARLSVDQPQFLVMQGRVTAVINMKPLDVLDLFQEAVGTNVFDRQRRASERTLNEKNEQLARIDSDISTSLQPTLDHLRAAKQSYVTYVQLGDKIVGLRRLFLERTKASYEALLQNTQESVANGQSAVDKLERHILNQDHKVSSLEDRIRQISNSIQSVGSSTALKRLESKLLPIQRDIGGLKVSMEDTEKLINERLKQIAKLENELVASRAELDSFVSKNAEQIAQQEAAQENEASIRKQFEITEARLTAFKQGVILDEEGDNVQDKVQSIQSDLSVLTNSIATLGPRRKALSSTIADLKPKVKSQHHLDGLERTCTELKAKLEAAEKRLQAIAFEAEAHERLIAEHGSLSTELEVARQELEVLERKSEIGRAKLFRQAVNDPSLMPGAVFELFEVKENFSKYVLALEECAKSKLRQIVVRDDRVAQVVFEWVKARNQRATCMPLNKVRGAEPTAQVKAQAKKTGEGFADVVVHPMECLDLADESHRAALCTVFPGVFLCQKRETAEKLYNTQGWKYPTITTDGEKWDGAGNISGGSTAGFNNILTDAANYRVARRKVDELEKRQRILKDAVVKSTNQEHIAADLSEEVARFRREAAAAEEKINTVKEVSDEGRLRKAEEGLAEVEKTERELKEKVKDLEKKLKPLTDLLNRATANHEREGTKLTKARGTLQEALKQAGAELAKICEVMTDMRTRHASLTSRVETIQEEIKRIKDAELKQYETTLEELKLKFGEKEKICATLTKELQSMQDEQAKLKAEMERNEVEISALQEDISNTRNDIVATKTAAKKAKDTIDNARKQIKAADEEMLNQSGVDQAVKAELDREYKDLGPAELKEVLTSMNRKRGELQMKIDRKAIELLAVAEKDFDALKRDKARVEEQRDKVLDFITNIDAQKKVKLETSFAKVNGLFNQIFSTLLPGAEAMLGCIESNNLGKGLEMQVKLGGTRKLNLTELSGGQKSLLALSLILALLKLNPSPFYILDEVDAALDANHTQHLGEMIKKYFSESQFIVISHKDNLYRNADVLFRTAFKNGTSAINKVCGGETESVVEDRTRKATKKLKK